MTPQGKEIQRHALDYWQIIRNRLGLIVLCTLLVFAVAAIVTYIMPRKFRATTKIIINRDEQDAKMSSNTSDPIQYLNDTFFKTQFEIISKRKNLDKVVEMLNLDKRWTLPTKQYAVAKLRANLETTNDLKSDFVDITFYDEDAQLAADVANAVVEAYTQTRLEIDNERIDRAVDHLDAQIELKELATNQTNARRYELVKRLKIVDLSQGTLRPGSSNSITTPETNTLLQSAHDVYTLQKEIRDMSTQVAQLTTLEGEDLIRQSGELRVENETIKNRAPDYQALLLKEGNLRSAGLGRKHPTMVGIREEIEQVRKMLLDAAMDYRKNLTFRLETAKKALTEVEGLNQEMKETSITSQSDYQEYIQVKEEWEDLKKRLMELKDTKEQRLSAKKASRTPVTTHEFAQAETAPAKPNIPVNLAIGGLLGLILGFGVAFFLEYLDTSVKSIDDVEALLGVPVLAVIPKDAGIIHRTTGANPDAEAYRILRTNLEFNRTGPNANVFSVVSGGAGEGKSTTMVNLATVCAQGGHTTLIIDGDLRRPRMHTFFDISNSFGLSNYLTSNVPLEEVVVQTPVENLYFLPSGLVPADSAGLLNSKRFADMLADVKSRFDIVLIDSPPILGVSDASVIAAEADMTLIVVQHRKLPRQMLQRVKQSVESVGGTVAGVVLNNVDIHSDATYGYYTSYYTYYSTDSRADPSLKPAKKVKGAPAPSSQPAHSNEDVF